MLLSFFVTALCLGACHVVFMSCPVLSCQDAAVAMSELELLFKYLDAMGTLKVWAV